MTRRTIVHIVLACIGIAAAIGMMLMPLGCTDKNADRIAVLRCADHGGVKNYTPEKDRLLIECKDAHRYAVAWLP